VGEKTFKGVEEHLREKVLLGRQRDPGMGQIPSVYGAAVSVVRWKIPARP